MTHFKKHRTLKIIEHKKLKPVVISDEFECDKDKKNHTVHDYIDELKIFEGIAHWIESFTPPTEPYTI